MFNKFKKAIVFLTIGLVTAGLNAAIDNDIQEQLDAWREIYRYRDAQQNPDYSNEAFLPGLFDRIAYAANFMRPSIQEHTDRLARLDRVVQKARELDDSKQLNIVQTIKMFSEIAMIGTLEPQDVYQLLPGETYHYESHKFRPLGGFNPIILCAQNAILPVDLFVDGFLTKRSEFYLGLPNKPLEKGAHGGLLVQPETMLTHDIGHQNSYAVHDFERQYFWPGYEKIKTIRDTLTDAEKKIVDAFLICFFHESYLISQQYGFPYRWKRVSLQELEILAVPRDSCRVINAEIAIFFDEKDPKNIEHIKKNIADDIANFDPFIDMMLKETLIGNFHDDEESLKFALLDVWDLLKFAGYTVQPLTLENARDFMKTDFEKMKSDAAQILKEGYKKLYQAA